MAALRLPQAEQPQDAKRRSFWRVAAFCALTTPPTLMGSVATAWATTCLLKAGPRHTVAEVIDAETVRLETGQEVRLIGILAPRGRDAGLEPPSPIHDAAHAALKALVHGRAVRLKYDRLQRDRHGRILAHLFVVDGDAENWVQTQLLPDGHARAMTSHDNPSCATELLAAESIARTATRGLWQMPAYAVRDARDMARLARLHGTFQIVRGTIGTVRTLRDVTEIELAGLPARRTIVRIFTANRDVMGVLSGDARNHRAEMIEARGWIVRETSPSGRRRDVVIDTTAAGLVTRVEKPRPAPQQTRP